MGQAMSGSRRQSGAQLRAWRGHSQAATAAQSLGSRGTALTGVMTAVYRMEYQGWSWREALDELKAHGFGAFACTAANDYITQYVLTYRPGKRSVVLAGER